MRWTAYVGVCLPPQLEKSWCADTLLQGSTTLAIGVVLKALHQRANFYSACVYLAQSNANLMVRANWTRPPQRKLVLMSRQILTNFIFMVVCGVLLTLQKVLYGPLRPIEIEQLYEKAWFAVTETCLAMTIFPRGELGGWFLVMFFSLLAGKVWSWIGEGRVEFLEQQPPANPRLFHSRLAISLSLAILFNSSLFEYSVKSVLQQARPDMMVMFGFEFAILTIGSFSTAFRYGISLAELFIIRRQKKELIQERRQELRRERAAAQDSSDNAAGVLDLPGDDEDIDDMDLDVPGWEDKGRWVFYLDLITGKSHVSPIHLGRKLSHSPDFLKLNIYCAFFAILLTFYGLPIHIIRDVFFTFRSFANRVKDFMRYRTATRDMNDRYPDATPEEVADADVCIICREEMTPWPPAVDVSAQTGTEARRRMRNNVAERMRPKKLPCGHVLHFSCLRSWLERQQNCPTCRRPVLGEPRLPGTDGVEGGAPGGANGHQPGQGQGGEPNRENAPNRPRIINLGPLRIGFGAGRGNLINDLARGVNDGEARQDGDAAGNAAGPQQYGFGIGWNRDPPRDTRRTLTSTAIPDQIRQLEQQIQQQIDELQVAADQLQVIRALQAELSRLQTNQANGSSNIMNPLLMPGQQRRLPPWNNPAQTLPLPAQILSSGTQSSSVPAGSSDLPEGLVLPEGWSILPLHRMDHGPPRQPGTQQMQSLAAQSYPSAPANSETTALGIRPFNEPNNPTTPRPESGDGETQENGTASSAPTASEDPRTRDMSSGSLVPDSSSLPGEIATTNSTPAPNAAPTTSSSIPSWGFGDTKSKASEDTPNRSSGTIEHSEATEPVSSTVNGGSVASGKGKAKAATVEDFIEDVD